MSNTITVTDASFADDVLTSEKPVLVDFWAAWCGPCRMFAPVFEKASEQHADIVFGKIDTENQRELAAAFHISSIPTLMVFREGVLVFSQSGALGAPQLDQLIAGVRGLDMDAVRAEVAAQQAQSSEQTQKEVVR